MIQLDTSFAVDLLREMARKTRGAATLFLESSTERASISMFVACELRAGAELSSKRAEELERVTRFCATVTVDYPDSVLRPSMDACSPRTAAPDSALRRWIC